MPCIPIYAYTYILIYMRAGCAQIFQQSAKHYIYCKNITFKAQF